MAYRSVEVANEFLRQHGALGVLTQMQLQKLVYMANGWNWAINGEQLVSEPVQAWDYGPVYRDLYDHTKFFGKQALSRPITSDDSQAARVFGGSLARSGIEAQPYVANLNERERLVVEHVWKRYGGLSGGQLSALTHQADTPWFRTYTTRGKSSEIDQSAIREHYDEIVRRVQGA